MGPWQLRCNAPTDSMVLVDLGFARVSEHGASLYPERTPGF